MAFAFESLLTIYLIAVEKTSTGEIFAAKVVSANWRPSSLIRCLIGASRSEAKERDAFLGEQVDSQAERKK